MKTVYFIKPIGMDGPIKIGCSQSPASRKRDLETWSPFPLEIIATITGDHDIERRFHAYFQESHQRREWFNPCKLIADTVAAINTGDFDFSVLPPPIGIARRVGNKRKGWTQVQKLSASLNYQATKVFRATGYIYPFQIRNVTDEQAAKVMQFLEAPHTYGEAFGHDCSWAAKARAAYHESIAA